MGGVNSPNPTASLVASDGETPQLPATLFGTNEPAGVVAAAQRVSVALSRVLDDLRLVVPISGRRYVLLEGWTLLGSMTGVFAEVEWSRRTDDGLGWEARAVARTLSGRVVGAAEALCSKTESHWRNRDDYALRSMAQTRAVAKALRLPLGFIVEMGGYSATPAEEMADVPSREARRVRPEGTVTTLRRDIRLAAQSRGIDDAQLLLLAQEEGASGKSKATVAQLRRILRRVEEYPVVGEADPVPDEIANPREDESPND